MIRKTTDFRATLTSAASLWLRLAAFASAAGSSGGGGDDNGITAGRAIHTEGASRYEVRMREGVIEKPSKIGLHEFVVSFRSKGRQGDGVKESENVADIMSESCHTRQQESASIIGGGRGWRKYTWRKVRTFSLHGNRVSE